VRNDRAERSQLGFTLVEVIVAVAVLALTMAAVALIMNKANRMKRTADALSDIRKIENALELSYREAVSYVEKNCSGWGQAGCTAGTLTPSAVNSTTLSAYLPTQSAQNAWTNSGCTLTGTSPTFSITCQSGYGTNFTYSGITNTQAAGAVYTNGFNKTPYSITISATIPGATTTVQDTWSAGYLDVEYFDRGTQKILTLLRAMKAYHFNRLLYESNTNSCAGTTGGLASTDAAMVPWVWELIGSAPTTACSGGGSCGCSNFTTSIWSNLTSYLQINSASTLSTLVNNLGIDPMYQTDGFGNMLTVRLLTDKLGNILSAVPSSPKATYSDCLPGGTGTGCSTGAPWSQLPPYTGVVGIVSGGSMIFSLKAVYAN
jgi:prepilin-type N-terminal cleavage/methylation domain-containing protein